MIRASLWLLALIVLSCWPSCSRRPTEEEPADPLALQHRLSAALDSADRAECGAPKGCKCLGLTLDCPNVEPPGHP